MGIGWPAIGGLE